MRPPRTALLALVLSPLVLLTACGGGDGAVVSISPVGNEMRYAQTEFTVHPGQEVRLIMNNTATLEAMRHNVTVLQQGADANAIGQAAMTAMDTDYIPASAAADIIAHTPMADAGATTEVTFTAPAAGDYPYICTFPGHYMMMQGTMHVVAE